MSEQAIKKVLITGANGFIGGSLMRYYQNQGQDVVGVDLGGNGDDIVEGDISQPDSISQLLTESDVIIHTAALVSNAMQDSDMWRVNVLPHEFKTFLDYSRNLKFTETPDYDYLRNLLNDLLKRKKFENDSQFDWILIK